MARHCSHRRRRLGESRRWILENDLPEAIVALPDQLFYNTGISAYVWVLSNNKPAKIRGKVALINAVDLFRKMRKSLGNKRNELAPEHIDQIAKTFGAFTETGKAKGEDVKVFDTTEFGFTRITIERPLRLSFQASPERIARLKDEGAFQKLATSKKKGTEGDKEIAAGRELQTAILRALGKLEPDRVYKKHQLFEEELGGALHRSGLDVPAPVKKAILSVLSERDEAAETCTDA